MLPAPPDAVPDAADMETVHDAECDGTAQRLPLGSRHTRAGRNRYTGLTEERPDPHYD